MAHQVTLKRMFRDPRMDHSHTYYLIHKDGRQEHLLNVSVEYNTYYKRRMWWSDPIAGPGCKYPTKAEAISDALKLYARSEAPGRELAQAFLIERRIDFSKPVVILP